MVRTLFILFEIFLLPIGATLSINFIDHVAFPLLIAIIISFALQPVLAVSQRIFTTRVVGAVLCFLVSLGIILFTIGVAMPLIASDFSSIALDLPQAVDLLSRIIPVEYSSLFADMAKSTVDRVSVALIAIARELFSNMALFIIYMFFIPTLAFFFSKDVMSSPAENAPGEPTVLGGVVRVDFDMISDVVNREMSKYVKLLFSGFLFLAPVLVAFLTALGFRYAIGISVVCGVFSFIPVVTMLMTLAVVGVLALVQMHPDWHVIAVAMGATGVILVAFEVVMVRMGFKYYSEQAIWQLALILLLSSMFGLIGMFLAVPMANIGVGLYKSGAITIIKDRKAQD